MAGKAVEGTPGLQRHPEEEAEMVVTRDDVYEHMIFAERPVCPHCGREMSIWECWENGFSCGCGWDTPYLFVCFNDECPAFAEGWQSMKETYGRTCSYRCICLPDSRNTELMLVFSSAYGKPDTVDEEIIAADRAKGKADDRVVQDLGRCCAAGDVESLVSCLFDETRHCDVRLKAAELIGELGMIETIEPLSNHKFDDARIATAARDAVRRVHEINGTRECPHCAEFIKADTATCRECGRQVA